MVHIVIFIRFYPIIILSGVLKVGRKGNNTIKRSINFEPWMYDAIETICDAQGMTFTSVVHELLRRELEFEGYSAGIGRPLTEQEKAEAVYKTKKLEAKKTG